MIGKLAISKSGHDKGQLYVIVGEDERNLYLADGVLKTIDRPKKKNKKHVQPILRIPAEVEAILSSEKELKDLEMKRALKCYRMRLEAKMKTSTFCIIIMQ